MIKIVPVETIYPLRAEVLRPGLPIESCHFETDHQSDAFHLAYYHGEIIVGVLSMLPETHPDFDHPKQYRLRGMATHSEYQGQGIGKKMLLKADEEVKKRNASFIWCHAREIAYEFYKRCGYEAYGDVFDIPTIGNHTIYIKRLL